MRSKSLHMVCDMWAFLPSAYASNTLDMRLDMRAYACGCACDRGPATGPCQPVSDSVYGLRHMGLTACNSSNEMTQATQV